MKIFRAFYLDSVAKPRMTRSDVWKKRPSVMRYRAFCDSLRDKAGNYLPGDIVSLEFYICMPKSWSKKKKKALEGKPHQQTPDIDNLIKAFLDALLDDDSSVWSVHATKHWAVEGKIVVKE